MQHLPALRDLPALRLPRMVRDFLTGLVVFGLIVGITSFASLTDDPNQMSFSGAAQAQHYNAGQYAMPSDVQSFVASNFKPSFTPSTRVARTTEQTQGLLILGLVFSAMVAFNLAFLRHLRRVYASPRQGAWRRSS
jgi:hypothetical protein